MDMIRIEEVRAIVEGKICYNSGIELRTVHNTCMDATILINKKAVFSAAEKLQELVPKHVDNSIPFRVMQLYKKYYN